MEHGLRDLFPVQGGQLIQAAFFEHPDHARADFLPAHGDQPQGDAFAVVQRGHILAAFDAVADGVAEIEDLAQPRFFFILFDDGFFDLQRADDDFVDICGDIPGFKQLKQLFIRGQRHFDGLCQTVGNLAGRQRPEQIRVDQDFFRLIKSADDVFHAAKVNGRFAADGGVDL